MTNFSTMSPIFEKTIPNVQKVQTTPSVQEFQVDPQMLVVVNVNITQPKLSYVHYNLKPNLNENWSFEEAEVLAEITAAQEKLKIAEMIETLYESKQQRSETTKQVSSRPKTNFQPSTSYLAQNNEERQTSILDIHQSTRYRPKDKTYRPPIPYPVRSSPSTHQNTSNKKI